MPSVFFSCIWMFVFNMPYLHPSDTIMSDEPDYSQLPLGERLVHKVWKVRAGAYDEVVKAIETSMDADSIAKEHLPLMKKMVMDSNVMAQGKGIAAGKRVHATACPLLSDDTLGLSSLPPSSTFPATIARCIFFNRYILRREWNVYTKKTQLIGAVTSLCPSVLLTLVSLLLAGGVLLRTYLLCVRFNINCPPVFKIIGEWKHKQYI